MIVRNQESIRSLAESPDLVAHMHEVRSGRRLYLTYDLKRALRHVSKVHGMLIAQRQGHQLARSGSASVIDPAMQGMARVQPGQAPAWSLVSGRSVRRGLRGPA
jgi:hypothetical protein